MPRYLLDSNVIDFQRSGGGTSGLLPALVAASTSVAMVIVDEVYGEVAVPPPNATSDNVGKRRAAQRLLDGSGISVVEILPRTPESAVFQQLLRSPGQSHDLGEAASIAFARYAPADLVFVTGDKNGAISALNEIHGRGESVMRVPVFVCVLYEAGALAASVVRGVAVRAASHGLVPTWWAGWLAALPP
jgi:hypothetical protein